ncbi:MAG: hypothetical protein Q4G08_02915 [Capnocytophaga sp.]|nr:hypothetical protein [Capnocytophaga sp.]
MNDRELKERKKRRNKIIILVIVILLVLFLWFFKSKEKPEQVYSKDYFDVLIRVYDGHLKTSEYVQIVETQALLAELDFKELKKLDFDFSIYRDRINNVFGSLLPFKIADFQKNDFNKRVNSLFSSLTVKYEFFVNGIFKDSTKHMNDGVSFFNLAEFLFGGGSSLQFKTYLEKNMSLVADLKHVRYRIVGNYVVIYDANFVDRNVGQFGFSLDYISHNLRAVVYFKDKTKLDEFTSLLKLIVTDNNKFYN